MNRKPQSQHDQVNGISIKSGVVLLTFHLREFPAGVPGPNGEAFGTAPPHWRLEDPNEVVTCWGHVGNGSFESMVAITRLAAIGAKHATQEELVEAGIVVKPKIWTPESDGDVQTQVEEAMAVHVSSEEGGFVGGKRIIDIKELIGGKGPKAS